ncbi:MAG: TrkH family potassium uptake protein [Bacteroidia bacterium]|nr:TrkH family potassium uptake protein [Bacteroidia bacterium]
MRTKSILKYMSYVLLFNALFLFISAGISFFLHENTLMPLFISALISAIGGILPIVLIGKIDDINFREGIAISVFGWILACLAGALPFILSGGEFTLANAIFESMSGFTTTGASILQNVEGLSKGLLFWRASTHFIGGIGVILFVLLILPDAKSIRASIYRTEVSGLSQINFKMRANKIIRILSIVYVSLTIVLTALLRIQGMSFFDSVCHAFTTIATGGFSTKNLSIAFYDNPGIEITLTIFMYLSSLHFGLLFLTFTGNRNNIFTSRVIRAYTGTIVAGILLITLNLIISSGYTWVEGLRHASFQVVSITSTTGIATLDTNSWPLFSKIILIYFSIQCAMVGSTSGGIKFDRIYLFFASLKNRINLIRHPQGVYLTKMNGNVVSQELESQTMAFIILYMLIFFVVTLILSAMNIDETTAITASIATLGNVGPGFGEIGSLGNFSGMPDAAKYLLSVNMLLGRLEILNVITLLVIFIKKNQ